MENKFELLDEPRPVTAYQTDSVDTHARTRRFKTVNNSVHPIQIMVSVCAKYIAIIVSIKT